MRRWATFAAGVFAGVALWGTALAAIPDSGGVIHGCYKSDGKLRVIDTEAGQTCDANETALTWNQTGPQGPAGPEGPAGPTGPEGPEGPAGTMLVRFSQTVEVGPRESKSANVGSYVQPAGAIAMAYGHVELVPFGSCLTENGFRATMPHVHVGFGGPSGVGGEPEDPNAPGSGAGEYRLVFKPYMWEEPSDTTRSITADIDTSPCLNTITLEIKVDVQEVA